MIHHVSDTERALAERVASLEAEIARLRKGLHAIASWHEGDVVTGAFDEPHAAMLARGVLGAAPPAQPSEPVQLTETEIFKAYTTATGKVLPNMGSSRAELVAITRIVERAHGITGEKK